MTVSAIYVSKPDAGRQFIRECCGAADIVPLDALSAPLVNQMQNAIRSQHKLLEEAGRAIQYLLSREQKFRQDMFATESEERLTTVLAQILNLERSEVARHFGCFHRNDEEEA